MSIADFYTTASPSSYPPNRTPRDLGYWFIETDSCWDLDHRDPSTGQLLVDPTKYPHGLKPVVEYLGARNITFGLYGDRGTLDCNQNPGQLGHEAQDAEFLAAHGIGWFKVDSCHAPSDKASAFAEYMKIGKALSAAAAANGTRPIWYALCGWQPWYAPPDPSNQYPGGMGVGNSWRVGPDTGSGWSAVLTNVVNAASVARYSGPSQSGGGWNDGSLLLNPGMGCPGTACASSQQCAGGQQCVDGQCAGGKTSPATCMTESRASSMFSLWCVLGLNLVMTGNLPLIQEKQPFVLQTWLNSEAIAVDQDAAWNGTAGLFARRLDGNATLGGNGLQPGHTAECGGEPADQVWTFGTPDTGYLRNAATSLCLSVADCGTEIAYDACETNPDRVTCAGKGKYPHFQWEMDGSLLRSNVRPDTCAAATPGGERDMTAVPCNASDPSQQWSYDPHQQQLTNQGHCLTANPPAPPGPQGQTSVYGRPLLEGAWAIVMLNDTPENATIECGSACTAAMGFHADAVLRVRDLVQHKDLPEVKAGAGVSVAVPANGSSVFYKLSPTAASSG